MGRLATRCEERNPEVNNHPFSTPFFTILTEQWQTLLQQSVNTLGETSAQSVKAAFDQFLAGQTQMAHLTTLVTQAWVELATNTAATTDWSTALEAYLAQLRQQVNKLVQNAPSPQQAHEFWQLYSASAQKASQPWITFWQQMPQWFAPGGTSPTAPDQAANQAFHGTLAQMWQGLLGVPTLGLQRQSQEKLNRWAALALENQHAQREYQLLIGNAWVDAFAALMQRLLTLGQTGKSLESPRHLLDLWVEVADTRFLELFHSAVYATAQGKLVNSNMALRQQQRELLEIWLRQHDLPTRSDLEEAHRGIYELRKEIKALKKALATLQTPASQPVAPTKARRGRRANNASVPEDKI